ncbi:MAG: DUF3300 domain-containing protein [Geobacteraceae bacterium]|nr:DUF3300 domain-containing protein [Geobacteraceae bacterium]
MRALAPALRRVIWIVITVFMMPAGIMAQDAEDSDQEYKFSEEELAQMLAPIALYPDALTAQVLMASTYPLEVVEAERWRSQNLQLKGNDLDTALQSKNWDPSVKSLCHFPDILKSMSDKLDQTRKLGDAFLGQEEEVMATIQELRGKAMDQGNLKTTGEQKVTVENDSIKIEPANPEVIYVPVYDPAYVYGPWWYPAYPPYYWYYPPGVYSSVYIGFGPGVFFGLNAFSWAWFDWPVRRVHIDINRTRSFHHVRDRRDGIGNFWRHNPQHRRGVAYRDLRTSERFGARAPRITSPSSQERRGYPGGRIERQNVRPSQPGPQRGVRQAAPQTPRIRQTGPQPPQTPQVRQPAPTPRVQQAPAAGTPTPVIRREGAAVPQVKSTPDSSQSPVLRDTPFRGIGEGSFERKAGERGDISNRSNQMRRKPDGFSGGQIRQRLEGGGSRRER